MLPVLRWVEQLGEVTCDVASAKRAIQEFGMMVEVDIEKINGFDQVICGGTGCAVTVWLLIGRCFRLI